MDAEATQDDERKRVVLVTDYVRGDCGADVQQATCEADVRVYTQSEPTPPRREAQGLLGSIWSYFAGAVSEEEEFLEFAEFCEYYYQLAERAEGWDDECYDAVMKNDDFVRFHKDRDEQRRVQRLKQFPSWCAFRRDNDQRSSLWAVFKSGKYKSARSFQHFLRTTVKRDFKEYVLLRQAVAQSPPTDQPPPADDPLPQDERAVQIHNDLRRVGLVVRVGDIDACLRFIATKDASFELRDHVFTLKKSIEHFAQNPQQLWEIIRLYADAGLLKQDQVTLLKQCEVTAKDGFEAHVRAIQAAIRDSRRVLSTRSHVQSLNDEFLARFRLRQVGSLH